MSALGLGAALDGLRARRFGVRVVSERSAPTPTANDLWRSPMSTTSSQGRDSIAITTSEPLLTTGQVAPPRRAQPRGDPPLTGPNGHSASVDVCGLFVDPTLLPPACDVELDVGQVRAGGHR
jgi:hypothetical protein